MCVSAAVLYFINCDLFVFCIYTCCVQTLRFVAYACTRYLLQRVCIYALHALMYGCMCYFLRCYVRCRSVELCLSLLIVYRRICFHVFDFIRGVLVFIATLIKDVHSSVGTLVRVCAARVCALRIL